MLVGDGASGQQGVALFQTSILVRFGDLDAAGIAYYPRIFNMCHVAFEEMWEKFIGRTYASLILDEKLGMPLVHAEADFFAPLEYGAAIAIRVGVAKLGSKSVKFQFDFFRADDRLHLARIRLTNAMVNMRTFRSVKISATYRDWFERLMKS